MVGKTVWRTINKVRSRPSFRARGSPMRASSGNDGLPATTATEATGGLMLFQIVALPSWR